MPGQELEICQSCPRGNFFQQISGIMINSVSDKQISQTTRVSNEDKHFLSNL